MASVTRQPFAPLDSARLQNLTSQKNRQNAITPPSASKRKAEFLDTDDSENVDPLLFIKRSKGANTGTPSKDILKKPSNFMLTTSATITNSTAAAKTGAPIPSTKRPSLLASPTKANPAPRRALQPKSPAAKLSGGITKSTSSNSVPAGRSPTRGKRSGILSSRRRTVGPYTRVDPPSFSLGSSSSAPFSLDAALKGTISGFNSRAPASKAKSSVTSLLQPEAKASWFFDIHEDTPEQEMTNMLQHGTCVLDISSDEESEQRASRERAEGRNKENIPPPDDVSQTSSRKAAVRDNVDDMVVDKERVAMGELNAADFYAEGCDETSVILIPEDEDEEPLPQSPPAAADLVSPDPELDIADDVEALMAKKDDDKSSKAAVLQPIEGTGESFELWESDSTKDEADAEAQATAAEAS